MTLQAGGEQLLGPVQAAIRLGVTSELLFHYAIRGARTVNGAFRLPSRTVDGGTVFAAADVDAFDVRLSEPRSAIGERRVDCDAAVTAHLRVEAGGGCARCHAGVKIENAHIEPYSATRSNHHRNVIRLCSSCHDEYDRGLLGREQIEDLKRGLVQRVRDRLAAGDTARIAGLPPRAKLLGRDRDLTALVAALRSVRAIVVRGVGGIGKTQLVLHAAAAAGTGRPLVWIPLEECGTEALLHAYVAAAAGRIGEGDPFSVLASVRACVVLDGVERGGCGLPAVSRMVERLAADGEDIQVVLTTQARLPEIAFDADLPLDRLDRHSSAHLLPADVRKDDLAGLLEIGDGHPLTLRILAALVRHLGGAQVVVDRVRRRPELPVELPGRAAHDPGSSLDRCLGVAYDGLDDRERLALWVLAQLPAGLATGIVDPARFGIHEPVITLATLRRWHLVDDQPLWEDRLITMLSPVRDFVGRAVARSQPPGLDETREGVALCMSGMIAHLNNDLVHGGHVRLGMRLLDRELPNAMSIFELACTRAMSEPHFRSFVTWLAFNLQTYFFSSGAFAAGAEVMRTAADLAMTAGQPFEALELLSQLQSLAGRAGRDDLADLALQDARKLDIETDARSHAVLLSMEAHVGPAPENPWKRDMDLLAASIDDARRSFELLMQASGGVMTHRATLSLLQQAALLSDARRPAEALPLLDQGLVYLRKATDPINAGAALQRRGNCLADLQRPDEAMQSYAEAAILFHELETREYRSNTLCEAGLVLAENPAVACPAGIRPDILADGIGDAVDCVVAALPGIGVPGNDWPYNLTRKVCGVIVLGSLVGNAGCIARMGHRLRTEVAEPLMARETDVYREAGGSLVTRHFGMLAWLCDHLGDLPDERRHITLEEVESLAVLIEVVFFGDLRDQMFGWLARFLSERHGLTGLETGDLRGAVDDISRGRPFELIGFDLP
ncbi:HNH endonuclease [Sphingomonas aerolata]|uniref:HNH endonuclease n=1 Tax=Sphingomonas aerolata TaxID=185951 RepID=UPI00208FBACC|nr:HNH endonuclease [Sphingomonas aerolata]USR00334.1 HNH endonuclease [Sphingomonas aerolata]